MTTSSNKKGLRKHITQITGTSSWEGIDFTLRKLDPVLDDNGKLVSVGWIEVTINGIISQDSKKMEEMAGKMQNQSVKGLFVWPEDGDTSLMPVIEDRITGTICGTQKTYVVKEIPFIDWDINDPVLITAMLQEIPNED
jgi:hypothetical protein